MFVTTKLWISDYRYDQALIGVDGCLRRLGLDSSTSPPPSAGTDQSTDGPAYTALEKALADERTRAIGVSNFSDNPSEPHARNERSRQSTK